MAEPELQRVRGRGGVSARTAAVVAAVVLAAVAWAGITGRAPRPADVAQATPPGATPAASDVIAAASASPEPEPTGSIPHASASPATTPGPAGGEPFRRDAYGVIASIQDRVYLDVLEEVGRDTLRGSFRVPFPSRATHSDSIEIAQLWTLDTSQPAFASVGTWRLRVGRLVTRRQMPVTLLKESVAPSATSDAAPRAVRRGYTIRVRAEDHDTYSIITVDVELGQRGRLGDDGSFDELVAGRERRPETSPDDVWGWRAWWQSTGWYPYADGLTR